MSLLSLEHVSKRYPDGRREITALDDVSLTVNEGDFVGIWGMRRSGKTTLLLVAAGRQLPDEGAVCFDGEEVTRMSPKQRVRLRRREGIGLLDAEWRPARNKLVVEHVALPLLSDGMSLREAKELAWNALERVGVAGCALTPAGRLSHSERMRVALAQVLAREPLVLLVDEPAVLASPSEGVKFYELLRSLSREASFAVVIASEDIAPIRTAQRMFSIEDGRLRSTDQPGIVVQFPERTHGRRHSRP
jgi:putative ABC transport system ATP-binding protein